MAVSTIDPNGLNIGQIGGTRNKIINGAMTIDQRNAGAAVTPTDGQYTLDRWRAGASAASKFSVQQSSVAPAGFSFSTLCTSLSAYSVGTNDNFEVMQFIEGFNTADLEWGTADAQPVTLSFWVRSSLTGTFGGTLNNSAFNRSFPFSYTISAADTWEYKTISIAGDTSGTWIGATNGTGVVVSIGLGAGTGRSDTAGSWYGSTLYNATGAVSLVGTSGATLYFTGVQVEAGDTATPFEHRSYGQELALCQRYYSKSYDVGTVPAANDSAGILQALSNGGGIFSESARFPVMMRAGPTVTLYSPTGGASALGVGSTVGAGGFFASQVGGTTNSSTRFHYVANAEL